MGKKRDKVPSWREASRASMVALIHPDYQAKVGERLDKRVERKVETAGIWAFSQFTIQSKMVELDRSYGGEPPAHWQQTQESINGVFGCIGNLIAKDVEGAAEQRNDHYKAQEAKQAEQSQEIADLKDKLAALQQIVKRSPRQQGPQLHQQPQAGAQQQ